MSTKSISIHAPAQGATRLTKKITTIGGFHSTLPRRERPTAAKLSVTPKHFNPRSRAGSDRFDGGENTLNREFQSTLPRRERRNRYYLFRET